MKRFAICTMILAASVATAAAQGRQKGPAMPGLTLTTTAFEDGGIIPTHYTMNDPHAVSPKLEWSHVPKGTVSFTLILHDPDVSMRRGNGDVLHWMIFNIPGSATELPEGIPVGKEKLDDGTIQAKNLRGQVGYMGPGAPPAGPVHHYTFELYALDTKLDLGPEATRADVLKAMEGHILGKGVLVGRFHR